MCFFFDLIKNEHVIEILCKGMLSICRKILYTIRNITEIIGTRAEGIRECHVCLSRNASLTVTEVTVDNRMVISRWW